MYWYLFRYTITPHRGCDSVGGHLLRFASTHRDSFAFMYGYCTKDPSEGEEARREEEGGSETSWADAEADVEQLVGIQGSIFDSPVEADVS